MIFIYMHDTRYHTSTMSYIHCTLHPRRLYPRQVDAYCLSVRLVLIDGIGSVDSAQAQRLLLRYVLRRPRSDEEVHSTLAHLITMTTPIPALVAEVERRCFGQNFEMHGKLIQKKEFREGMFNHTSIQLDLMLINCICIYIYIYQLM